MIDLYKFCFLSYLGREAGMKSTSEYNRETEESYDGYLLKARSQREKVVNDKPLER